MDERPAPDWLGDVTLGVEAWAGKSPSPSVEPPPSVEPSSRRRRDDESKPTRSRRRQPRPADPADPKNDPEPDHEAIARKILLDALTGQARSRKELADKLEKKEVPAALATRTAAARRRASSNAVRISAGA